MEKYICVLLLGFYIFPAMLVQSSDDKVIKAEITSIYAHRNKITNPHVDIAFFGR